jgi:hypothetical protein
MPNVTVVNSLGDFDITDDKLAFIDGEGESDRFICLFLSLISTQSIHGGLALPTATMLKTALTRSADHLKSFQVRVRTSIAYKFLF